MLYALLPLVALCGVASALPVPHYSTQYTVAGTISLPYGDIHESFVTYFDGQNGKQRIDYYNGLDIYITDTTAGDKGQGQMYQVNPVDGSNMCFLTDSVNTLSPFFPDFTGFKYVSSGHTVNDRVCDQWQLVQKIEDKVNTYNFFAEEDTMVPVQYSWLGYDTLLGSHYDQYVVDYQQFDNGPSMFNMTTFSKPGLSCGGFPGPGYTNAASLPSRIFSTGVSTDGGYDQYKNDHSKSYPSSESTSRQHFFDANLRYIHMTNRRNAIEGRSMRLAVNFLADHTDSERAARAGVSDRTRPTNNGANFTHPEPEDLSSIPTSINWVEKGAVTWVKDQGICGSCWSFGSAETIEGAHFLKTGILTNLSSQALMDCSWGEGNLACDGGEDFRAYQWIMSNKGIPMAGRRGYGDYLMADGKCHAHSIPNAAKITGYVNITVGSVPATLDACASKGPISISIDAALKSLSFYSSGVYYDANCKSDPDSLDHSVLLVGYGSENNEDYWIIKNSWSVHWGDKGFVKMSRKDNICGVATAATYTLMDY